jgi:hypothetical protein
MMRRSAGARTPSAEQSSTRAVIVVQSSGIDASRRSAWPAHARRAHRGRDHRDLPGDDPVVTEKQGFPLGLVGNGTFTTSQDVTISGSFDDGAVSGNWSLSRL